ncbi:hypothetical protein RR46_05782 [Papilio xuthus]|uniref:Uncharacterized protein n=1 Tax=Papilio xuthus TaxID=66420 RepID=A0A194PTR6_PAPXU|nr:hypothetical protein RR46_05782 [Papilio xuthus]
MEFDESFNEYNLDHYLSISRWIKAALREQEASGAGAGAEACAEEEARAERKRRQRQAQEEFRLKQLLKQKMDDQAVAKDNSSVDNFLMGIPTQDIAVEASGAEESKRKSPNRDQVDAPNKRRNNFVSKPDIL